MVVESLGMMYNSWSNIVINGDKAICTCSCGNIEEHCIDDLIYDKTRMCKNCIKKDNVERQREKLENQMFGSWHVENFLGNRKYLCTCTQCNKKYEVAAPELKRGKTLKCKSCSGNKLKDLTGKIFGNYRVIRYVGNHYWECECLKCGKHKNVTSQRLTIDGCTQCIECSNKERGKLVSNNTIQNTIGKTYGNLVVKGYNSSNNKYICECQCKNKTIIEVYRSNLLSGGTRSCGCLRDALRLQTMIERYGDIASKRIGNPRKISDIQSLIDKQQFIERYNKVKDSIERLPNSMDLAEEFDITTPIALKYAHMYGLDIDTDTGNYSKIEEEICEILKSHNINYRKHARNIIYPKELDIYIPERKVAIEVNGSYWHSTLYVDKYYHQNKTLDCIKNSIRLIHIFEHEWNNNKEKLKELIISSVDNNYKLKLRASKLQIKNISDKDTEEFINKYHIQGYIASKINLGLIYNNEIVAVMTFGNSRFDNNYEYEILRFCVKPCYQIYGATSKLIKAFINKYNPVSIVTYSDASKFTGNAYIKSGFKINEKLTEPSYVWVNSQLNVLSRYQTQKHILVKNNLGSIEQTEDDIMSNLGYYKVYNSGNFKLEWKGTK